VSWTLSLIAINVAPAYRRIVYRRLVFGIIINNGQQLVICFEVLSDVTSLYRLKTDAAHTIIWIFH